MIEREEFLRKFGGGSAVAGRSLIVESMTLEDVDRIKEEAADSLFRKWIKAEDSEGIRLFHNLPDEDGGRYFQPDWEMSEEQYQRLIDEQERRISEIIRKNGKVKARAKSKGMKVQLTFELPEDEVAA